MDSPLLYTVSRLTSTVDQRWQSYRQACANTEHPDGVLGGILRRVLHELDIRSDRELLGQIHAIEELQCVLVAVQSLVGHAEM